jgi:DMSO/TMAO reductase YedYZ molybdopterin-dependent catalytic subunit
MTRRRNRTLARRDVLAAGLASAAGLWLTGCGRENPPTYGNLLRAGDNLTYQAHRLLLPPASLAREYSMADLSSFPATGTTDPGRLDTVMAETWRRQHRSGFADWRLSVTGAVARPAEFSLADLRRLPSRTQITRHTCEEGWTAIGQWTGAPLSAVLDAVGASPAARFVSCYSTDDWADSIDMVDALHPQTILAYGMNGRDLPVPHGAPVRLRVERQIGYKSMKYLTRIVVTETLDDGGPKGNPANGWAWYTGI